MLGDPVTKPAHFFLPPFMSLNLDRPLHALSLLSIEDVVQLFFATIGDAPVVISFLERPRQSFGIDALWRSTE